MFGDQFFRLPIKMVCELHAERQDNISTPENKEN